MKYEEAVAYILEIPKFAQKNRVAHTKEFLKRLGSPCKNRKLIHVAGTNGKGSVCAYIQALLLGEGKTAGFFTSPHLISMNERIKINGVDVDDDTFLAAFHEVYACVKEMMSEGMCHPNFFEFLFGMCLVIFEKKDVEYGIIETGIGGLSDTTNAIEHPFLTIITSISLDHTDILGETIEEIAVQKAGIMKPGTPVICDGSNQTALAVIRKRAEELKIPCREISKNAYEILESTEKHIAFSSTSAYDNYITWELSNSGCYQAQNAMIALTAMHYIAEQGEFSGDLNLWKQCLKAVHWEGRMEEIEPSVYVDGAHNPGAVEAFTESIRPQESDVILFSAVSDKNYESMIEILCRNTNAHRYIITKIESERAAKPEEMEGIFRKFTKSDVVVEPDLAQALKTGRAARGVNGKLYCLGSLYLAGKIKELVGGTKHA